MHFLKLKFVILILAIVTMSGSLAGSVSAQRTHKIENRNYYRGLRLIDSTKASRKRQQRVIPKRFRGVYYSWNYLRNRQERLVLRSRRYQYSHKNGHGKWSPYEEFAGKKFSVGVRKDGALKLQLFRRTDGYRKYAYFEEDYAIVQKKGHGIKLQIRPYRHDLISHRKVMTFKKHAKRPVDKPQKLTRKWFVNHRFTTCYYYYLDSRYQLYTKNNGAKGELSATNYWDPGQTVFDQNLSFKMIAFIPDKHNPTKAHIILGENMRAKKYKPKYDYYSLYVQKIQKNYLLGLKDHLKKYRGRAVTRLKQLQNRHVVRLPLSKRYNTD